MSKELLIALLAGAGGMMGWGLADFLAKKTIDRIGDIASLAWGHVFGTVTLILMLVGQTAFMDRPLAFPQEFSAWAGLAFFGTLQAGVYLLLYKGFGQGQLSLLNPVFASYSGLTAALSILVFGETVSAFLLVGLFVLGAGVFTMSVDLSALRSRKLSFAHLPGFKAVAGATVLATFWTLGWDRFVDGQDGLSYTFLMYAWMTAVILIVASVRRVKLSAAPPSLWVLLALMGLCETVAYLAVSVGYSLTSMTSLVALLSGAFSLPTLLLARLFLKERVSAVQGFGILLVLLGLMLLVVL